MFLQLTWIQQQQQQIVCVVGGGVGGLGVIIKSNLNRVRLSCCWVGVGLGCDNFLQTIHTMDSIFSMSFEICDIVHFNKNSTVQNGHIVICHLSHCLSPMSLNYSETQSSVTCYAA